MTRNELSKLLECHTYSSCESGSVCISYRKYVDGFIRVGGSGLFVYLGSDKGTDLFSINGVDIT